MEELERRIILVMSNVGHATLHGLLHCVITSPFMGLVTAGDIDCWTKAMVNTTPYPLSFWFQVPHWREGNLTRARLVPMKPQEVGDAMTEVRETYLRLVAEGKLQGGRLAVYNESSINTEII